jgi:hypothetical protein
MTVRRVVAVGFVLLLAAVAFTLFQSAPRVADSNGVRELEGIKVGPRAGVYCQDAETIPGDSAELRVLIGTFGRPLPAVRVNASADGRTITTGELPAGGPEGRAEIPIEPVEERAGDARVCLRLRATRPVVLYGEQGRVRFEWMRPGSESWFAMLPTVAHRFGLGRASFAGSLLLLLAALVLLAAWALAVRVLLREAGT